MDDEGGMLFFGKRQSRDRLLIADLINSASGRPVYASLFSKVLFEEATGVNITDDPVADCPDGGICFIENISLMPILDRIGEIVIYRWNRLYPSDKKIDIEPRDLGFRLKESYDFVGTSHNKITKEVYER